jgi:hypothetical protein
VNVATLQRVLTYVRRTSHAYASLTAYNIAALVISDTLLATRPKGFTGGTHLYLVFAGANNQPRHTEGGTEPRQLANPPVIILPMGQIKEEGRLEQTCQRWGQTFCMWNAAGGIDSHVGTRWGHISGHYPEQLIELILACQQKRISLSKILGWVDSSPHPKGLPLAKRAPTNKVLLQEFFSRGQINKNYPAPGLEDRIREIFRAPTLGKATGRVSSTLRLPVTGGLLKHLQKMTDKTRGTGKGWLSHIWLSVDPRRKTKSRKAGGGDQTGVMQLYSSDGTAGTIVSWDVSQTETDAFWEGGGVGGPQLWIARVPRIIPELTQKDAQITLTTKYQSSLHGFTVQSGRGMARTQPLPPKSGKKEIRYTGRSASVTIWHDSYSGVMASDPHLYYESDQKNSPVTIEMLEPIITAALSDRKWGFTVNGKELEREIKRELAKSLKPLKGTANHMVIVRLHARRGVVTFTCYQPKEDNNFVKWASQSISGLHVHSGDPTKNQILLDLKYLRKVLALYSMAKIPTIEVSIGVCPDPSVFRGVTDTGVRLSAIVMPVRPCHEGEEHAYHRPPDL